MEFIYPYSERESIVFHPRNGNWWDKNIAGSKTLKFPTSAYKRPFNKVTTPRYLSHPQAIPLSAPFSIAIRNASYNLNADPDRLFFTPKNGLYPRAVGQEGLEPSSQ
jgi:hypothetical protein